MAVLGARVDISRRNILNVSAAAAAGAIAAAPNASAAPLMSALGRDATHYGIRPGSPDDQTQAMQRAIDDAAKMRMPLALPPGSYRTGTLKLPQNAQLVGVRGMTRLELLGGTSLLTSQGAANITLANITCDGNAIRLPTRRGLIHFENGRDIRVTDCELINSGGNGIWFEQVSGAVRNNIFGNIATTAVVSFDAQGLLVAQNTIAGTRDNGIEIIRNKAGDDGTLVLDNRIEDIVAGPGGSGQHGNAINAFRAGNVIVRGNRIRNCDFSGVRGNSASNIQIIGNSMSNVREVAIYSEFAFEGAIVANNTVDICAIGIAITNFNEGGRLAVVQGNILRNMLTKRPAGTDPGDAAGVGIGVEADTTVTGNVIENAPTFGILAGWKHYLRDVAITGNVIRNADIGVGVSVSAGAGQALVSNNVISGTSRGAVVGFDQRKAVTGDLAGAGTSKFAQLVVNANLAR